MRLWSAETISQFGTQVTLLALPLTAVLVLHAGPFRVGLLSAVEFMPFLLLGLPAGVWVDRIRRKPILIGGDLLRAAALISVPIAAALDVLALPQLFVVGFLTGVGTVFFDVAYQSYLPSLVDRDRLPEGNAKLEISRSGAQLAGPGIAGVLIEALTAPVAILVDAISYVASAACIAWIRRPEHVVERPPAQERGMRREIAQGLRFVLGHPLLRPIAFCTGISNLFYAMTLAILLVFAVRSLDLNAGQIGIALSLGNLGFLAGALIADRLERLIGLGASIVAPAVLFGVGGVCFGVATPETAIVLLISGTALLGFTAVVYNVNQVSLRQAITQENMLGRMNATMRFVVWGTIPLGSFLGGVFATVFGLRSTLWIAALGATVSFVPLVFSPVPRLRTMTEAVQQYGGPAGEGA